MIGDKIFRCFDGNNLLIPKMRHNLIEAGDNEDITNERLGASFSVEKLAIFIHGGEEKLRRRREILKFVESQEDFQDPKPPEFMSREERVENNARKIVAMTDKASFIDQSDMFEEGLLFQSLIMGRDFHGMSLHYGMFIPTIQGQMNDDQLDYWLPLAISRGIIGTYAQTELGHGTNIAKLETTATYDEKTDEFVLNTPSVSATKWWSGGLGKSSNYAIIPAQLIINGSNKGLHMFIAQLRHLDTHMPLPGITVGDIGPKMGIPGNDNGFLIFNNYRIPRENMLMRYSQVLSNGKYIAPKHSKLRYGSMVFVRSLMVRDQAMQLAAAVTIAVRYSAVRRQGGWEDSSKELQVLDYRTQQYRTLPYIAQALVFLFAATEVKDLYKRVNAQLSEGITDLLQELHILSSGFKAVVTWEVAKGIEQCRLACGGHGYSHASGLPEIYSFAVGGCTYEGENIVMLLQVARFLMKTVKEIRSSSAHLADIAKYLLDGKSHKSNFRTWQTVKYEDLIGDFEQAARNQIYSTFEYLQELQKDGHSPEEAWNCVSVELCQASRADYMSDGQMKNIKCGIYEILGYLRRDAVAIVDSFDFSDRELHSVLGRRDGNVYAAMLDWAKYSELNKTEFQSISVSPRFMEKPKDAAPIEQVPFVLKKWNALAMWSWDVECDICAICRVQLMDACLRCQSENKQDDCVVVWGECNHSFHNCCMALWVKQNNRCPLCQQVFWTLWN
uniref:Acyl-coenzyme A oxidase n=1 Tax=Setaria digitata TaxID=48799 RepID=A0A915PWU0_9BILA